MNYNFSPNKTLLDFLCHTASHVICEIILFHFPKRHQPEFAEVWPRTLGQSYHAVDTHLSFKDAAPQSLRFNSIQMTEL